MKFNNNNKKKNNCIANSAIQTKKYRCNLRTFTAKTYEVHRSFNWLLQSGVNDGHDSKKFDMSLSRTISFVFTLV